MGGGGAGVGRGRVWGQPTVRVDTACTNVTESAPVSVTHRGREQATFSAHFRSSQLRLSLALSHFPHSIGHCAFRFNLHPSRTLVLEQQRGARCVRGPPAGHLEKVRMETIACRARHYRCDLRASFFSNFLLSSNSVVSDPCASLKLIKSLSTCRGQGYNGMASMPCTRLRYSPDPCSAAHGHWQSPRQ